MQDQLPPFRFCGIRGYESKNSYIVPIVKKYRGKTGINETWIAIILFRYKKFNKRILKKEKNQKI